MSDAPLSFVATPDGEKWTKPANVTNGYSDYGLQMAMYRGELYGIMTQTVQYPKQLFATKYKVGEGWKAWRSLPSNYLALGRAQVAVLEDRFYIVRRGTNDAVYLTWTDDFDTFVDVGRIGSKYATTKAAPAIAAFNGKLYLAGVGPDKYIYTTIVNRDGERETSWSKVEGTGTRSSLEMEVYDGKLFLLHCGYNGDKFFYQSLDSTHKWGKLSYVNTNITSGLSATTWKYNELAVTFRGRDKDVKYMSFNGKDWSEKKYIPGAYMRSQTGASTFAGMLVVSFAARDTSSSGYQSRLLTMNEKSGMFEEVEEVNEREWDCKWDENNKQVQKSWARKFFCM